MKSHLLAGTAAAFALAAVACGSSGYGGSTSPTPTPTPGQGGGAGATIAILGDRSNQSFAPNPATAVQGTTVAFVNNDTVTHHIVMNDGSLDTGNIGPGQASAILTMATNGGNYHCTIHPGMVGSIRASDGQPPPCQGDYC